MPFETKAAAPPPATLRTWLVWWPSSIMMLGTLLSYLDRQVLALLSPMILRDTHMNAQAYGEVISAFSFAYMLSTPVWGSLLDRVGLRIGMTVSVAIWAVASAGHSLVSTFLGFAVARGSLGIGEGAMFPGGFRTAMDSLPPEKQSRGIALAYSGSSAGSLLAPLLITPLAVVYGWRIAFLATPVAALVWLVLWRTSVDTSKFAFRSTAKQFSFPSVLERRFWSLVASYSLGALPVGGITYLAPLYLSRSHGLSQKQLGLVLWIPPAALEIGFFFWGWIADRFARGNLRPTWLLSLLSVLALPCSAVAWFSSSAAALALLSATMFAAAGFTVVTLRIGALAYPSEQRSMAAGIASGSFSAVVAMVLPIGGRLFDQHMYGTAFSLVAFLPLLGTVIWWLLHVGRTDPATAA
ncbi:MAG: MFS transporter [Acidobacteriia bacterium]|nr:MFS transporter [Terriglobia bacterium]